MVPDRGPNRREDNCKAPSDSADSKLAHSILNTVPPSTRIFPYNWRLIAGESDYPTIVVAARLAATII
jgi:hypothetical protein